jgi:competence ComEA-like helix-hairpin-helix protein
MSVITHVARRLAPLAIVATLLLAMGGSWSTSATAAPTVTPATAPAASTFAFGANGATASSALDDPDRPAKRSTHKELAGKLNLNTANEDQLQLLPSVGPSKADRIVAWRKKNGGFKRIADLRRVKGFGYKTLKKLEPFLDVKGDTTLVEK